MRHRNKTSKLQRPKAHRRSLLANQACSLIEEGQIKTTLAKAKALRPVVEKLVTLGKKGIVADSAGEKAYEQGLRTLTVEVKGPGSGRETALRSLQSRGFKILSITDKTPMAHNGARPPKRRRV